MRTRNNSVFGHFPCRENYCQLFPSDKNFIQSNRLSGKIGERFTNVFSASFPYTQVLNQCLCYQTCQSYKGTSLDILVKTFEIPGDSIKNLDILHWPVLP